METFTVLTGVAAPLQRENVDTDLIIPIKRLVSLEHVDLGHWAFEAIRYRPDGTENPDFVLNQPAFRGASILIAGRNFGCGSSREGAVVAIRGMGIRCVIAPSFGDIFFNNCLKNGIVPARLPAETCRDLRQRVTQAPGTELTVDLETQLVDGEHPFSVDPFFREMLLKGVDEIGLTLTMLPEIEAFERAYAGKASWAVPATAGTPSAF